MATILALRAAILDLVQELGVQRAVIISTADDFSRLSFRISDVYDTACSNNTAIWEAHNMANRSHRNLYDLVDHLDHQIGFFTTYAKKI